MNSRMSGSAAMCPSMAILSHWSDQDWDRADGIQVETRDALDRLLVRGGRFFQEFTDVHLAGSSLGGSFLKLTGIYVGLRMELFLNGETIITSPVTAISVCPLDTASGRLASH
jgi:hypothetical protein